MSRIGRSPIPIPSDVDVTINDRHIDVKRQSKRALSGTVEWSDVFLEVGNQTPVDASKCEGVNCGQPSLSENGRQLVFIKAQAE